MRNHGKVLIPCKESKLEVDPTFKATKLITERLVLKWKVKQHNVTCCHVQDSSAQNYGVPSIFERSGRDSLDIFTGTRGSTWYTNLMVIENIFEGK